MDMSIAVSFSAHLVGLHAEIITVEVDIANGLHAFAVVGLGDRSVGEAKDRISAAIKNSGYKSPKQKNQKVVISLGPADIHKEGTSFDLAMAITYLAAAEEISFDPSKILFLGELSLEGKLRTIGGILPILCQAGMHGFETVFVPFGNAEEASLARGIKVYGATDIKEVIAHISGEGMLAPIQGKKRKTKVRSVNTIDMNTVRGNEITKRGLEIAAAGAHNIIMSGPPGTGKTMLAQCFSSILPPLSYEQSIEVTGIHSTVRILNQGLIEYPPFRSPHHTASYPSIVGGGAFPKPGEITLAHRGVLFLDELPEFDHKVIESLRQPLEDRMITISRARGVITFPAQCILIASMNPCPCGKGKGNGCICSERALEYYRRKISGPILDRVDIWVNVNKVDYEKLSKQDSSAETSADIQKRVIVARDRQLKRFEKFKINKYYNSEMNAKDIELLVVMQDDARATLALSSEKMQLSGRAFHRMIKVAMTIADLGGQDTISKEHILEALQYRQKN